MSKSVLVIDMPKRCKDCSWYQADPWFGGSCEQVKEENGWNKHIEADEEYNIQNWCPLKEGKALAAKLDEAKELLKDDGTPMTLNEFLERFHPKLLEAWEKVLEERWKQNGRKKNDSQDDNAV